MGGTRKRSRAVPAAVAAAALAVPVAALAGITGPIELLSIGPEGTNPVTMRGAASVDGSGRYVAFSSAGRDLDPTESNPHEDVFVRDRQTGTFERVSLSVGGQEANGPSTTTPWSLSADANRVAFASKATNLISSDNNLREDVFVRDRAAGTTQLVSSNFAHLDANGNASEPAISADGSAVAFTSDATDMTLVPDLDGKRDVYVRDLASGDTTRVSETPSGAPANGPSSQPVISADGSKVAFVSSATDLVANDTNAKPDVFVRDLASGQTTRVSVGNGGVQANNESTDPFISPDGSVVGFSTLASNLGGRKFTGATSYELYLRDLGTSRTERLSMRVGPFDGVQVSRELGDGTNRHGAISADNRLVAFDSTSTGYVSGDSGNSDVFVLDRATDRVAILSRTPSNTTSNGSSYQPAISASGVAFRSSATNLATPGGAFNLQVFFRPYEADAVAADIDGDGIANVPDVCPLEPDPDQADADGEGRGDACDIDDDSDSLLDPFEDVQGSDRTKADTDGDGYDDVRDDYPTDPSKKIGTDHQRLNVAQLDSPEGEALAKFFWDDAKKRFEVRVTGALSKKVSYTTVVYRRHPAIRLQTVCVGTTNDVGALQCVKKDQALNWFTHVELRRGSTVLATAVCDDPDEVIGERRCDVLE